MKFYLGLLSQEKEDKQRKRNHFGNKLLGIEYWDNSSCTQKMCK